MKRAEFHQLNEAQPGSAVKRAVLFQGPGCASFSIQPFMPCLVELRVLWSEEDGGRKVEPEWSNTCSNQNSHDCAKSGLTLPECKGPPKLLNCLQTWTLLGKTASKLSLFF